MKVSVFAKRLSKFPDQLPSKTIKDNPGRGISIFGVASSRRTSKHPHNLAPNAKVILYPSGPSFKAEMIKRGIRHVEHTHGTQGKLSAARKNL
jgi:hypothetical protein